MGEKGLCNYVSVCERNTALLLSVFALVLYEASVNQ